MRTNRPRKLTGSAECAAWSQGLRARAGIMSAFREEVAGGRPTETADEIAREERNMKGNDTGRIRGRGPSTVTVPEKARENKPGMAGGEERKVHGMSGRGTGEMRQECRACGEELVPKRSARTTGKPPARRGKQDTPLGMRMTVSELAVWAHRLPAVCKPRTMAEHIGQLALTFLRPEASGLDVPSEVQIQAKRTWRFPVIESRSKEHPAPESPDS